MYLGHFLGLTVAKESDEAESGSVYECDVDDDVTSDDDEHQFDDMMRNLGAVGLLEKFVLYEDHPRSFRP